MTVNCQIIKLICGVPLTFLMRLEEIKKVTGQTKLVDFDKVKPVEIPLIVLSGGVKLVGEASKVSS